MKQRFAWIFVFAFLGSLLEPMLTHASAAEPAEIDSIPGVASFEGTYDRLGSGCDFASQAVLSEETDPTTDLVTYHLRLLRDDGRVWNSREYRQLNGLPWYKADIGNDATVSGRSRYSCTGPDCTLSNERKTCKGLILPRCTGWVATRQDEIVFENSVPGAVPITTTTTTMTISTETDSLCSYVRR